METMNPRRFLFKSLVLLLVQGFHLGRSLPCPLEWELASLGLIPDQAVESGAGEYVARISVVDQWYVTKINPRLRKISVMADGKEVTRDDYEVLTNPNNCILKWVRTSNKNLTPRPEGAVPTAFAVEKFVGRGKIEGYIISGTVSDAGLAITHQGKEIILPKYEILAAIYSQLYGSLTSITFNPVTIEDIYKKAHQELVGTSLLEVTISGQQYDSEKIFHEKQLNEQFVFTEENFNWLGISSFQISMNLWFGTSDVKQLVQINGKPYFGIERSRQLQFSKDVSIRSDRSMQVCTMFLTPSPGTYVEFEAIAELTVDGDDVDVDDVKNVVVATGRTVLASFPLSRTVTTIIKGNMTGRFALDVSSKEIPLDKNNEAGKCREMNGKPRSKQFN